MTIIQLLTQNKVEAGERSRSTDAEEGNVPAIIRLLTYTQTHKGIEELGAEFTYNLTGEKFSAQHPTFRIEQFQLFRQPAPPRA